MKVHSDLSRLPAFRNSVITIGSFDGVHIGHCHILQRLIELASRYNGESIVVTFEPHPRTVLQPADTAFKLLSTTEEKIRQLEKCGVDHVVLVPFTEAFARMSARAYVEDFLIKSFQPRCIVIGYDHRFGAGREGNIDFLKQYKGFELQEIPAQEVDEIAVSSSKIRKALEQNDILKANRLLGHPFQITGRVVRGNRIGTSIGYPTANLFIGHNHKLIPPAGIYAAEVVIDGQVYGAMLYIGSRPTVENDPESRRIEVNVLGFEGDLYDRDLPVSVLDFIRNDKKLDSLEELKQQITADKAAIEKRLAALKSGPVKMPDVAVVILNYNTRRHLETYLPSVIAHSAGARIIVADNGSPDDSVVFLREHFPQVEVLQLERNFGFAQGYNEALAQINADIYVILNSDVEVTPGWMTPVLEAMRANPEIGIAQPKIMDWNDKLRFEYAGAAGGWIDALGYPFCRGRIFNERETDAGQYDTPVPCFWAAGAAFFIRAELYHNFGGFDGDYFAHNEEIDLCWRLHRAGYSVWCIPTSVVYHLGGGTLEYDKPRKVYLNFRNSLFTIVKNEPAGVLCWLIPFRLVLDGVAGGMFLTKGKWGAIGAIVKAHFSFYRALPSLLRKRKWVAGVVQRNRRSTSMEKSGIFRGSIVWQHYIRRIKRFQQIIK